MRRKLHQVLIIVAMATVSICHADEWDEAEAERQAAFRSGMENIVANLNDLRFAPFVNAIDREAMVERILHLRLVDPLVKRSFTDGLDRSWEQSLVGAFGDTEKNGLKATLLGVESRGNLGRAVVRFDLPKLQFNYHEYDLMLDDAGRVIIVDWVDYLQGVTYTENYGNALVAQMPRPPALRKLVDYRSATDQEVFQLGELLKAARDRKLDKYLDVLDQLPDRLKRQRIVVETTVHLARAVRKRRAMLDGLATMAELYPAEPRYSLMLLDHYFPRRKYEQASEALLRLQRTLGFDDAAMEARLSAAALIMGNVEDAAGHASRAIELEDDLELAWWSTLNARATLEDYAASVEALEVLQTRFGYELGPDALGRNKMYQDLVASAEYRDWNERRGQDWSAAEKP
jgi:hypothetical protein